MPLRMKFLAEIEASTKQEYVTGSQMALHLLNFIDSFGRPGSYKFRNNTHLVTPYMIGEYGYHYLRGLYRHSSLIPSFAELVEYLIERFCVLFCFVFNLETIDATKIPVWKTYTTP